MLLVEVVTVPPVPGVSVAVDSPPVPASSIVTEPPQAEAMSRAETTEQKPKSFMVVLLQNQRHQP